MARLARLRLALNLSVLAASLLYVFGAVWAIAGGQWASDSWLAWIYAPLIRAWATYAQLGSAGKLATLSAAVLALALFLFVFLLTFRWQIEEWAVVVIGGPVYLLVAAIIALAVNLGISIIKLIARDQ
ncbi:MAG TPA: hypothetical protein VJ464_02665 [Blastocatellia bacterium]|nr:hypothetical protein [Blastocatellia bacterium]